MAICNADLHATRASGSSSRTSSTSARSPALLAIEPRSHRDAARRAVQGQGAAARVEPQGVPPGLRLRGGELQADRPQDRAARQGRRAASSSTATTRRRWARSTAARPSARGIRSRRRRRSPNRSRSIASKYRVDPGDGQAPVRDRAGRGRARVDRHGDRRRVERRARVHRDRRARHLADAGIHRARVLRRDPGGALRRAARQPVDRHADEDAAGRPADLARTRRTATPSTCCCSPKTRRNASRWARRRSTSRTGCRRRCS